MFSGHRIWCVFMFTALAVTAVVSKPASEASDGEAGRSTNEGGNREGTEMSREPSSDQDGYDCRKSNTSCPDPNSVCVNTKGSYRCFCKQGYFKLDGGLCEDLDECCTTDNLCPDPRTVCVNTEGSYTCGCKDGYMKLEEEFCHDIDECRTNNSCPDPHSNCINIEGSYSCPCMRGYVRLHGDLCQDIDECCTDNNTCPNPRTECINTEGSYTCECKEGYIKHELGICQDIDECATSNTSCPDLHSICINTEGSYICLCLEGYFKVEGGTCLEESERYSSNCAELPNYPPHAIVPLVAGPDVLCDTATDGGGWIVIQRRVNGAIDFYRNWTAYKQGFGDVGANFWLGNEILHLLTSKRQHELRIDMTYQGRAYFAQYDTFSIESEEKKYTLRLGAFSSKSNTTDNLSYHNGQAFSTFDRDNDSGGSHCAELCHGAWWYNSCYRSNLNGHWGNKTTHMGPIWEGLTGYSDVVTFSEMKIRRLV